MRTWVCVLFLLLAALVPANAGPIVYSNITNSTGYFWAPDGAGTVVANTITKLAADDITPVAGYSGWEITRVTALIQNANTADVIIRALGRFYDDDGGSGNPGTLLAAFSFGTITVPASSSFTLTAYPSGFLLPGGTFWAGLQFDNADGTTGATDAQLNLIRLALYDPPTVGSSADLFFWTSTYGDFAVNNPAGGLYWFGGTPRASFGWEFEVESTAIPEPGTLALGLLGVLPLLIWVSRRRVS
jgi:hypothetical protein